MASKKQKKTRGPVVKSGPMVECYVLQDDGRKRHLDPRRLHADLALQRIHVSRKTATIHVEGEYEGAITYEAK